MDVTLEKFCPWMAVPTESKHSYPNPQDRLYLRRHRARSIVLTQNELVEIRAAQRTFEGAYVRTALSQFSFALIVLKIFTVEFYAIGALYAVFGSAILLVAMYRRYEGNRQFFSEPSETNDPDDVFGGSGIVKKFRTAGNSVALMTGLSLAAYISLIVMTLRMD